MIIRRKITQLLAVALILSCLMTALLPAASADESRTSTNGYTYTNVWYNSKSYTISLGVSNTNTYAVKTVATCYAAGIYIIVYGPSVTFETINYGYITNRGQSGQGWTDDDPAKFLIETPVVTCSKGTSQVLRVSKVTGSAIFRGVNDGQDVTLNVTFTG